VPLVHGNTRDENRLFTPLAVGASITAEQYAVTVRRLFGDDADAVLARYPVEDYPAPIYALTAVTTDAAGPLSTCAHVLAYDIASSARPATRVWAYQFRDRTAPPYIDFGPRFEEGAARRPRRVPMTRRCSASHAARRAAVERGTSRVAR
jgi:para-nitrobenzyl esterase